MLKQLKLLKRDGQNCAHESSLFEVVLLLLLHATETGQRKEVCRSDQHSVCLSVLSFSTSFYYFSNSQSAQFILLPLLLSLWFFEFNRNYFEVSAHNTTTMTSVTALCQATHLFMLSNYSHVSKSDEDATNTVSLGCAYVLKLLQI